MGKSNLSTGRNKKYPPVSLSKAKHRKQGISQCLKRLNLQDAYSVSSSGFKVAEIFFPTNEFSLDENDRFELRKLIDDIFYLIGNDIELNITCIGGADYRGDEIDNRDLGLKRAIAVKIYIDAGVSYNIKNKIFNLTTQKEYLMRYNVLVDSVGETNAHKPIKGVSVSPSQLMKDRKVEIIAGSTLFKPPVNIAVTGNLQEFNLKIERLEINHNGSVIAIADGSNAVVEEQTNQISRKIRSRPIDYLSPYVYIEIKCSLGSPNNNLIATVECRAFIYNRKNEILFSTSANTEMLSKKDLTTYVYTPIPNRSWLGELLRQRKTVVSRVYDSKKEEYEKNPNYKREIRTENWIYAKLLKMENIVYNQLRGNHQNIKKRIEALLANNK